MTDLLLLIDTTVGQAVLAKFATVAKESEGAMRYRLLNDEAIRNYFFSVVRKVVAS